MEIIDPTASSKSQVLDSCEIRMEDLLQAKFENRATLDLFDQVAKVRVNTLIFLINRSKSYDFVFFRTILADTIYPFFLSEFYA
jgi:hypothetical protein